MMPVTASVLHSSILLYKDEIEKVNGYDKTKLFAEDHDLFLRLIQNGCKMYNIQAPFYSYRTGIKSEAAKNIETQQKTVYLSGAEYISKSYSSGDFNSFNYLIRIGLLEYYRGDVRKARFYFLKISKLYPSKIFRIIRYLIVSFLGNRLVTSLRKSNILPNLSLIINKLFRKDMNYIHKPDIK
jgi:hypothetical protein